MPRPARYVPKPLRPAGALALVCGLASGAIAGNTVQWQLEANVPLVCAILEVETPADRPTGLAITTTCNAERYQLVLHRAAGQARLRAASSSAGAVQISGGAVTITSAQPGYALTTVELAGPVSPETISITLQPI
jgi:hypothetical protein